MPVLAGDIGGTHTRFHLVEAVEGEPQIIATAIYRSSDFVDLATPLKLFLHEHNHGQGITTACLAVAGPVDSDGNRQQVQLTNLPWRLDSVELSAQCAIDRVHLINDFMATAYGIERLAPESLSTLQEGEPRTHALRLVVGAGTGFGVCQLFWQDGLYHAAPGEGGHIAFAPQDAHQDHLLAFLRAESGRVSNENLLSGTGLTAIYRFQLHSEGSPDSNSLLMAPDPSAAISEHAQKHPDSTAARALDLFVAIYGAVAGDLALITQPQGGLFITGGIAPKILPHIKNGLFMQNFNAKGKMARLNTILPVRIVTEPLVGLLGAGLLALRFLNTHNPTHQSR